MAWGQTPAALLAAARRAQQAQPFGFGGLTPSGAAVPPQPAQGFTPFVTPTVPPAGSYDPALDQALAAAQRGYGDLQSDIGTSQARDTTDYLLGGQAIDRSQQRNLADLLSQQHQTDQGYARNLEDLTTSEGRDTADHATSLADLLQSYARLGGQQQQAANKAGVLLGSASALSAAKRGVNEAHDQAPLDTNFQRALQDIGTSRTRVGQDQSAADANYLLQTQRTNEDAGLAHGQLNLTSAPPSAANPLGGREFQDLATQLSRGTRENNQFATDTGVTRLTQAGANGYATPTGPSNEFHDAAGNTWRVEIRGNETVGINPDGSIRFRRPRAAA